jgi:hypothetical protein
LLDRLVMSFVKAASALLLPLVACVHTATDDVPHGVAATGNLVVVAASADTTTTGGFGCGGGLAPTGPGVMFVSDDGGATFDRIEAAGDQAVVKIVARQGRFYGLTSGPYGAAIVSSQDGRTWTEVAPAAVTHYDTHDLVVASSGIYAPYASGYLASSDGVTWTDHPVSSGWYNPVMIGMRDTLVVGTANGTLDVSRGDGTWSQYNMPGMSWLSQVAPLGPDVLVTARMDTGNVIARFDLETQAIVQTVAGAGPVLVTPAGILDHGTGRLAPITASGIGAFADHGPAFADGAIDGNRVALIVPDDIASPSSWSVVVSNDGGATFDREVELATVSIRD